MIHLNKEEFVLEILDSREARADKQEDILRHYPYSLISFTLNTPGLIKDNETYRRIHKIGVAEILKAIESNGYKIDYIEKINKSTGSEAFFSIDIDSKELKVLMVDIEKHHPLGRIFDIDVFDREHNQMTRSDLGLESRKCLICHKDARLCMREKNHSYEDLVLKIEELNRNFR